MQPKPGSPVVCAPHWKQKSTNESSSTSQNATPVFTPLPPGSNQCPFGWGLQSLNSPLWCRQKTLNSFALKLLTRPTRLTFSFPSPDLHTACSRLPMPSVSSTTTLCFLLPQQMPATDTGLQINSTPQSPTVFQLSTFPTFPLCYVDSHNHKQHYTDSFTKSHQNKAELYLSNTCTIFLFLISMWDLWASFCLQLSDNDGNVLNILQCSRGISRDTDKNE